MSNEKTEIVCWSEIPAADMGRAKAFYTEVLKVEIVEDNTGPHPVSILTRGTDRTVSGHIYPGKPAIDGSGPTVHFTTPDRLEDVLAQVEPAGGKVVSPIITIPPGRFAYCVDTEGNSIGIFGK